MNDHDPLAPGIGFASAHHGEILQGIFHDNKGRLKKALVTLQYPECESRAAFYPSPELTDVICPAGMWKVHRASVFSMAEFATERSPITGGQVVITSAVPRGIGMGSSTADVTAVIRAIADFHGAKPTSEEIAKIAVRAEYASDPTMIDDRVVLFAQREGTVLESFGRGLPRMIVAGCNADPENSGIDTVALTPAEYSAADIDTFCLLRAELRIAVAAGDVAGLGKVATASALISQRFLPKPTLEFLLDLCKRSGGCGIQVAHSGTVAGVIFDPRRHGVTESVESCMDRMEKAGLTLTGAIGSSPTTSADTAAVHSNSDPLR
jgi:uncharacterized protein involved in propanediol utilization